MKIETQFNIGDTVWYADETLQSGKVRGVFFAELPNLREIRYEVNGKTIGESRVKATREELIEFLTKHTEDVPF